MFYVSEFSAFPLSWSLIVYPRGTKLFDNTSIIVRLGTNVTLPAGYTNVEANPAPTFIWIDSNDTVVSNNSITFDDRYAIKELYQLTIYGVTDDDIGNFVLGIINDLVTMDMNSDKSLMSAVILIKASKQLNQKSFSTG